jgi:hypothetical protein
MNSFVVNNFADYDGGGVILIDTDQVRFLNMTIAKNVGSRDGTGICVAQRGQAVF